MNKLIVSSLNCVTTFALLALTALTLSTVRASGGAVDTMSLTDEPGNWFKSTLTGTPFTVIRAGERVDFKISNCCTSTKHTVTLLMKPTGSNVTMDQDQAQSGTLSVDFDLPGVYLFHCKIHPYMTAVVGVTDASGNIPDVTSAMLPLSGISESIRFPQRRSSRSSQRLQRPMLTSLQSGTSWIPQLR